MAEDVDFVSLIDRVLRAPDPKAALLEVFRTIKAEEPQTGAAEGAARFDRFMESALRDTDTERRKLARDVDDLVQDLMLELATDTFEGDEQDRRTAVDLIMARTKWRKE